MLLLHLICEIPSQIQPDGRIAAETWIIIRAAMVFRLYPVILLYNKSEDAPIMNLCILYKIFVKDPFWLNWATGLTNPAKLHTISMSEKGSEGKE